MGRIVKDLPCPACKETGHDSNNNHLMVFEDGGMLCKKKEYHLSGEYYYSGQKDEDYYHEEKDDMLTIEEIQGLPVKDLDARGIRADVAEHFGVKTACNGADRTDQSYCYPVHHKDKIVAYRVRELPKQFYNVGEKLKGVAVQLFGQETCKGNKKLLIVGGQDDMLASYQMLKDKYPQSYPNVVSVTNGENLKSISDNIEFVNRYEEIILCFDQDDAGYKLTEKAAKLIGPKAKIMKMSKKDPNDMLRARRGQEFVSSFFTAVGYVPDGLLTVEDVYNEAIEMPEWGKLWPWPSLNKLTYGRRVGEGIYVAAAVKAGKTEWLSQMVHHVVESEGGKVLLIKFEQSPDETVKAVAGKIMHKNFSVPGGDFTREDLIKGVEETKGKLLMFNAYMSGDAQAENMWDRLKPVIRHAVIELGVKDVFIDPITQLTDGMLASDTDVELRRFSNELAGLARELGFFYYCFAHLKAPSTGKTHEEGGKVRVAQFRGSRAMVEKTKYALGIIRDQYADDPLARNTSKFHLLLNSGFGKTGTFDVFYDEVTGDYLEPGSPKGIVF